MCVCGCPTAGFRGFTVPLLRKLHKELGVGIGCSAKIPSTEVALMDALLRHCLGDNFTDAALQGALIARGKPPGDEALIKGTHLSLLAESTDFDEDGADYHEQCEKLRAHHLSLAKAEARRLAAAEELRASASSASSSSAASAGPKPRNFVPMGATGISEAEARGYLPPLASLSKDDRRENRWRVRAPYLQGERSRSWGPKLKFNDWGAMVEVIQLVWQKYIEKHGGDIPFDFSVEEPAPKQ